MTDDLFQRSPIGFVTTDQIDFFLSRVEVGPFDKVETPTQKAVRNIQGDAVRAFAEQLKAASDATESVDQAATRIYHEKVLDETFPQSIVKIRSIAELRNLKGLRLLDAKRAIEKAIESPTPSNGDQDHNPNSDGEFDIFDPNDDDD